ncbi:MAG: IS1096 element passenger TnpR family protein [Blastocatellia bacterium]
MRESPFADEMPIGRLPLRPGEAMVFHYDFGDDWRFRVELEAVDPPQPKLKRPKIIESQGKAPRQ